MNNLSMDFPAMNEPQTTFKYGDTIEIDQHDCSGNLTSIPGTVTAVREGVIYVDNLNHPFDQETLMPLNQQGRAFAPDGKLMLLRHTESDPAPLPSIDFLRSIGLPNLEAWSQIIDDWNRVEGE